jgi:hypothetical protein
MEQFDNLILQYNQILRVSEEIGELVEKGFINDAILKTEYRKKLVHNLGLAKASFKFTEEQKNILNELKDKIITLDKENIAHFSEMKTDVKIELEKVNGKIKLKEAYDVFSDPRGSIVNIEE